MTNLFRASTNQRNRWQSFPRRINEILLPVAGVNGIIDSRVYARCCGIMGTMMELCGLTQSTLEVTKKFTSLHARARINAGYMIAGVSMVATIFPHGNSIMYYGYMKFEENLAGRASPENTKCLAARVSAWKRSFHVSSLFSFPHCPLWRSRFYRPGIKNNLSLMPQRWYISVSYVIRYTIDLKTLSYFWFRHCWTNDYTRYLKLKRCKWHFPDSGKIEFNIRICF